MKKINIVTFALILGLAMPAPLRAKAKGASKLLFNAKTFCGKPAKEEMLPENFQPISPNAKYSWEYRKNNTNCYVAVGYQAKNKSAANEAALSLQLSAEAMPPSMVAGPANVELPILKVKVVCMLKEKDNLTPAQVEAIMNNSMILGQPFSAGKNKKCFAIINKDHRATKDDLQQIYFAIAGMDVSF